VGTAPGHSGVLTVSVWTCGTHQAGEGMGAAGRVRHSHCSWLGQSASSTAPGDPRRTDKDELWPRVEQGVDIRAARA
jgi:hypothetical protein